MQARRSAQPGRAARASAATLHAPESAPTRRAEVPKAAGGCCAACAGGEPAQRDALKFEQRDGLLRNVLTRAVPALAAQVPVRATMIVAAASMIVTPRNPRQLNLPVRRLSRIPIQARAVLAAQVEPTTKAVTIPTHQTLSAIVCKFL